MTVRKTTRVMPQDVRAMLIKQASELMAGKSTATDSNSVAKLISQVHISANKTTKNQVMARM